MAISNTDDFKSAIRRVASALHDAEAELCQLDGQIGDGDHGTTMSVGFAAITAAIASSENRDISPSALFELCSIIFLESVGATVGPLYAAAFKEAAEFCAGKDGIPLEEIDGLLSAMANGIQHRGKAESGDKTMMDVWGAVERESLLREPSVDPIDHLQRLLVVAHDSAQSTKAMCASKGRASRLGDRSLGHLDPGAISAEIFIRGFILELLNRRDL